MSTKLRMGLIDYFRKAGGISLIKSYYRTGILPMALAQFLLLGKGKSALELLRLIISLKVQKRLYRKYNKVLRLYKYDKNLSCQTSRKLWIFWWQGIDSAPDLVKTCYKSVNENLKDWEINLITGNNYQEYVSLPSHILEKFNNGQITLTHFSDILRLELLIKYGGLWLDATVLCTSAIIPKSILDSDLFVYQAQKPGADGHATIMSSWCMYAKTNNKILMATRELLYEYWKKNTKMDDYFLLHQFFTMACEYYPEEAKRIPPFCNSIPHILLLHLFDPYNEQYWNDLKQMACFHKLSYKLNKEDLGKKNTYYDIIIAQEI